MLNDICSCRQKSRYCESALGRKNLIQPQMDADGTLMEPGKDNGGTVEAPSSPNQVGPLAGHVANWPRWINSVGLRVKGQSRKFKRGSSRALPRHVVWNDSLMFA